MLRKVGKSQDLCKKKVKLHAEKSLSFRWLKLWELAENKKKKKQSGVEGGGGRIEQRSPVRAVVKAALVCFC